MKARSAKVPKHALTKRQIIEATRRNSGLSAPKVREILDNYAKVMCKELKRNGKIEFGPFLNIHYKVTAARAQRTAINRFTGRPHTYAPQPEKVFLRVRARKPFKMLTSPPSVAALLRCGGSPRHT